VRLGAAVIMLKMLKGGGAFEKSVASTVLFVNSCGKEFFGCLFSVGLITLISGIKNF
jgi:hypothetical protein